MPQYTRLDWQGQRLWTSRGRRLAREGLRRALEHLLQVSRTQVPLEDGTLERSGRVVIDGDRGGVTYDTVYAARQHEELTWVHPVPGRKAKYLEDPMRTERAVMLELMAVSLRRWLRG